MKTNLSDEELIHEVECLIGKLPESDGQCVQEIIARYNMATSTVKAYIPNYPYGILDALSVIPAKKTKPHTVQIPHSRCLHMEKK